MTKAQINYELTKLGYSANAWIDMPNVSFLVLDQDSKLYPISGRNRFYFDTTNSLLEVTVGQTNQYGVFTAHNGSVEGALEPDDYICFDLIAGFVRTEMMEKGYVRDRQFPTVAPGALF